MRNLNLFIKRVIDFLGSLFGFILMIPLFVFIICAIKLTSKGPIFFKQERLGKNGKVFKIYKFRTMIVNAEQIGTGLFIKSETDDRITRTGKFLRSTSLDELPQLFNVLKGEMSLVGPRPPVTHHPYRYKKYNEFQRERFNMKPGITGLAQIRVRNSVPWNERIIHDVEYIERFNILLDFKILIQTVLTFFKRESIY